MKVGGKERREDGTGFMGEYELASKQTRQPTSDTLHKFLVIFKDTLLGGRL